MKIQYNSTFLIFLLLIVSYIILSFFFLFFISYFINKNFFIHPSLYLSRFPSILLSFIVGFFYLLCIFFCEYPLENHKPNSSFAHFYKNITSCSLTIGSKLCESEREREREREGGETDRQTDRRRTRAAIIDTISSSPTL